MGAAHRRTGWRLGLKGGPADNDRGAAGNLDVDLLGHRQTGAAGRHIPRRLGNTVAAYHVRVREPRSELAAASLQRGDERSNLGRGCRQGMPRPDLRIAPRRLSVGIATSPFCVDDNAGRSSGREESGGTSSLPHPPRAWSPIRSALKSAYRIGG
jgi:hypothetical protein